MPACGQMLVGMSDELQMIDAGLPEYDEAAIEEMVLAAIEGDSGFPITVSVGVGERRVTRTLVIRWPSQDDETRIITRAAEIQNMPPELVSISDYNYARGMAMIETLSVAPFPPEWIARGYVVADATAKGGRRVDVNRLKSRAFAVGAWTQYQELQKRFLHLAC